MWTQGHAKEAHVVSSKNMGEYLNDRDGSGEWLTPVVFGDQLPMAFGTVVRHQLDIPVQRL